MKLLRYWSWASRPHQNWSRYYGLLFWMLWWWLRYKPYTRHFAFSLPLHIPLTHPSDRVILVVIDGSNYSRLLLTTPFTHPFIRSGNVLSVAEGSLRSHCMWVGNCMACKLCDSKRNPRTGNALANRSMTLAQVDSQASRREFDNKNCSKYRLYKSPRPYKVIINCTLALLLLTWWYIKGIGINIHYPITKWNELTVLYHLFCQGLPPAF